MKKQLAQEEKKELSFEEWLRAFNADIEELARRVSNIPSPDQTHSFMPDELLRPRVDRVLLLLILREVRAVHEHFDWIYPQLKILLKQDIRAQKKLLKGLR